ncbi:MAG: SPOR domain-containing protein [Terriglobales bacterium]
MESQDQEITLGTGRLLALFIGLVIICALFFSLGFSLGHRSEPVSAASSAAPSNSAERRPSPTRSAPEARSDPEAPPKSGADELTFYKAVERNEPKAKLEKPTPQVTTRTVESRPAAPELRRSSAGGGYMVQVAAVTKQEDADALVHALRRKSYPVLAINGPGDRLYHVQVGPFGELKEAEAARSKLVGDGYNPIVKK